MADALHSSWSFESRSVRRLPYGARRRLFGSVGVLVLMGVALGLVGFGYALLVLLGSWLLEPLLDGLVRARPGRLRVVDGRLWLSWGPDPAGGRTLSLGAVSAGWCEPDPAGVRVRLSLCNGDRVATLLPDRPTAAGLLDALGVGVRQRAFAVSTARPWLRGLWLVVAFSLGVLALGLGVTAVASLLVSPWVSLALAVPLVAAGAGCLVLMRPVEALEVVVGADGVSVRGELRERFHAFESVQAVCSDASGLALMRHDGTVVRLLGSQANPQRRARLQLRLEEALVVYRSTPRGPALAGLQRGEESYAAWVASLRSLVTQQGVYRASPLRREDFLQLLDNPHVEATTRVAAALALSDPSGELPVEARGRVRVAAEATANDALRVALERTLDGEFDERSLQRLVRVQEAQRG